MTPPEETATLDLPTLRAAIPALNEGVAYFDGAGGTQTPGPVAQAIAETLTGPLSNRGRLSRSAQRAEEIVRTFREAAGDLLGGDPRGVVYGRSATELTMSMARTLSHRWRSCDEIVVTRLEHDANLRPWVIAAERAGAQVRWVDFDPSTGELDTASVTDALTERTVLVAVTGASNLIGTRPDLPAIARAAHTVGALIYADVVHLAPHAPVDATSWGLDFAVFSPYKMLGPHCGVLWGRPELLEELTPDKLAPSTDESPERFELGTLPYETLAGATAAVDFIADLSGDGPTRRDRLQASMSAIEHWEDQLLAHLEPAIVDLPGVTVWSRALDRTPTLLVTHAELPVSEVSARLGAYDLVVPASHFYAWEACHLLGLGGEGGLRISLAPYTSPEEIDRLISALRQELDR